MKKDDKQMAKDLIKKMTLTEKVGQLAQKLFGVEPYLYDGVHPGVAGATLIADEWVKYIKEYCEK